MIGILISQIYHCIVINMAANVSHWHYPSFRCMSFKTLMKMSLLSSHVCNVFVIIVYAVMGGDISCVLVTADLTRQQKLFSQVKFYLVNDFINLY